MTEGGVVGGADVGDYEERSPAPFRGQSPPLVDLPRRRPRHRLLINRLLHLEVVVGLLFYTEDFVGFADGGFMDQLRVLLLLLLDLLDEELLLVEDLLIALLLLQHHLHLDELGVEAVLLF